MLMRWLFVCSCVLLLCGSANLTAARGGHVAAEVQRLPVVKNLLSAWGKIGRSLGKGALVVGTSLLLICGQTGCGGDEADETETVVTKVVTVEKEDTLDGSPFRIADYLDKYIIYVSDGDGSLATGYVIKLLGGKLRLRAAEADDSLPLWMQEELEQKEEVIDLQTVVGVMHRTHALIDEEVSFKRIHGAMHFNHKNRNLPDTLLGTVDVVYVEALLPEGSGEATAVGVTVHSGFFHDDLHWVRLQPSETIYLPIGRVNFREAAKDAPPPDREGEQDPNEDPNEDGDLVGLGE